MSERAQPVPGEAKPWRCSHCGLSMDARGWRLMPGECREYDRLKREYLAPRKQQVVEILEMLNQTGGEQ